MYVSTQFLLCPSLTSKGSSFHSVKMLHIRSKCWSVKWEYLIVNNKMQQRGSLREVLSGTQHCETEQKENSPSAYTWSLSWCSLPEYFSNSTKWWLHLRMKLFQVKHSWGEALQGNHGVSHSCKIAHVKSQALSWQNWGLLKQNLAAFRLLLFCYMVYIHVHCFFWSCFQSTVNSACENKLQC